MIDMDGDAVLVHKTACFLLSEGAGPRGQPMHEAGSAQFPILVSGLAILPHPA